MNDIDGVSETLNLIYDQIKGMFDKRQRKEIAQKKYTFLNAEQAQLLYGDKGPYNNTLDIDLKDYAKWTSLDKKRILMNGIRKLAGSPVRGKRQTFLQPTVLSPYLFAPNILNVGRFCYSLTNHLALVSWSAGSLAQSIFTEHPQPDGP
jgi:hypothetical protein